MKQIPYASEVGSLMYAQVYSRPDIAYPVNVLERFQLNLHFNVAKRVLIYLRRTNNFMLVYSDSDDLEPEVHQFRCFW